jgi:hypothetical protein
MFGASIFDGRGPDLGTRRFGGQGFHYSSSIRHRMGEANISVRFRHR